MATWNSTQPLRLPTGTVAQGEEVPDQVCTPAFLDGVADMLVLTNEEQAVVDGLRAARLHAAQRQSGQIREVRHGDVEQQPTAPDTAAPGARTETAGQ